MAYDEDLAFRVRAALAEQSNVTEKKMFGGLAFMVNGNMCVGVSKDELMLRVGPDQHETCLAQPHTRIMDFTGRPMRGFIYIEPEGLQTDEALQTWINRGLDFVTNLPPK